ncbi:hypothetical protein [Reichenbachiella sp.]|uniref:hypothetical protein n=1 Tax=Reichenbachiella sp. TaxID=2184521 RepID=UPI003296CC31
MEILNEQKYLRRNHFIKIMDPTSELTEKLSEKLENIEKEYQRIVKNSKSVTDLDLLSSNNNIVEEFNDFTIETNGNFIIDASCFPKRFFFPFVKLALYDSRIKNLLITYGTPISYARNELSEDPEPWDHLPLFGPVKFPESKPDHALVGVGFIPFGLSKLLKDKYSSIPVNFFFPFPPGAPHYQRSLEFLRTIETSYKFKDEDNIIRVNSVDISDVFNHIKSITENGNEHAIFAPYGPKPMSIAMAIYASIFDCPVYYTQPKKYNPNYSTGKGKIFAYLLKQNGSNLYY